MTEPCETCGRRRRYKGRRQAKALRCRCPRNRLKPPHPDRPTVPEVLPLVTALLVTTKGILGCCLRNVLESQCTSDAFVEDALERAVERRHRPCQELAYILSGMTRSQRSRLGYLGWREQGLASKRRQVEWLRDRPPKTAAR